ncbi:MAG TPA: hypothetical protein H9672_11650 [Firmicutes bacterium]|nr:hypothetical protein [Bacillota bacterium]
MAVPLGGGDRYRARVTASYDRDSGLLEEGANEYVEEEIFSGHGLQGCDPV